MQQLAYRYYYSDAARGGPHFVLVLGQKYGDFWPAKWTCFLARKIAYTMGKEKTAAAAVNLSVGAQMTSICAGAITTWRVIYSGGNGHVISWRARLVI